MSVAILAGTGRQTAGSSVEVTSRQVTASKPLAGWNTQPLLGSHESAVHGLPSSHVISGVEQVPVSGSQTPALWQASGAVQPTCAHWAFVEGVGATSSTRRPTSGTTRRKKPPVDAISFSVRIGWLRRPGRTRSGSVVLRNCSPRVNKNIAS